MTFRERVEAHPVGWFVCVGAASFLAGVFVTLSFMQVIIADRGPRDMQTGKNTTEPAFQLPLWSPATKPADSGNLEMTIQQFVRRYLELDGRYAEQEALLKRADRKRVRWKVRYTAPLSHNDSVTVYFDAPGESPNEKPLIGSPVRWATFPISFRDRVYSLKHGDLIEITGVLKLFENTLAIQGDDLDVITTPTITPEAGK